MFTQFDIIVSVITLFFVIIGFFSGAVRTIFSFGKWIGAWYVTNLFYPQANEFVSQVMQPGMFANAVATIGLFLASLISIAVVGSLLSATISGTIGGWLDKFLGVAIGGLQGVAVASIIHYCAVMFSGGTPPTWLSGGQTFEYTQAGANYFDKILKNKMGEANFAFDKNKIGESMPSFDLATLSDQMGFDVGKSIPKGKKDDVDVGALGSELLKMKSGGMKPNDIQKLMNQESFMNQFVGIADALKPGNKNGAEAVKNLQFPGLSGGGAGGGSEAGNLMDSFLGGGAKGESNKTKLKEFKIEDSSKVGFEGEQMEEMQ
jgi:membrane protein required for colicin V production